MDWAQLIQEVSDLKDVQTTELERLLLGLKTLEDLFGSSWLEEAASNNHPWIADFKQKTPWAKLFYGLIGVRLFELEGTEGLEYVLDNMKEPGDKCRSAQAELNAGWKLFSAGLEFEYRRVSPGKKTNDIRTHLDGREVSIECGMPRVPVEYHHQLQHLTNISRALNDPRVNCGMIVLQNIAGPYADYLIVKIEEAITTSLEKNLPVQFRETNYAEFCIAPKELKSKVDEWKKERDMKPETTLKGPILDLNLGRKYHSFILKKCRQISDETPGIVYLEGVSFHTWFGSRIAPFGFSIDDIQMAVYEKPKLLFAAFGNLNIGHGPSVHNVDFQRRTYVSKSRIISDLYEETWIEKNRFHKWNDLEYEQVINAFWFTGDSISSQERDRSLFEGIKREFELESR
jgi:hypothetical protein